MTNFWLKLKLWTKFAIFTLIGLYLIIFIVTNRNATVEPSLDFLFKTFNKPPVLLVLLITAFISIFGWWFFRMIFRTLRQFRDLREKNRTLRLEKEMAEMRAKAEKLQTREPMSTPAPTATPAPTPETKPAEAPGDDSKPR